jgi:fatty-acyl-CoA synthase
MNPPSAAHPHADSLPRRPVNHQPLTPLWFLLRSADVFPQRRAWVHGRRSATYAEFLARCRRVACWLQAAGIRPGDTVAALLPNTPSMLECHYAVPMSGAVLNTINTRLDAATVRYILQHGGARLMLADTEYRELVETALADIPAAERPRVVWSADSEGPAPQRIGTDYEDIAGTGAPAHRMRMPDDEWEAISLNYTSGTTGHPKGVVYHHRGAYLTAVNNQLVWELGHYPVYLWTLPMFHCNGWCFPWTVTALGGTHVCLRRVEGDAILEAIHTRGVTHFCGAPIILATVTEAAARLTKPLPRTVRVMTAAAPPPATVIEAMQAKGFHITHVYGLTETYGPAVVCAWQEEWADLPAAEQAQRKARQGVRYPSLEGLQVMDPERLEPMPRDGATLGEVMMRGNIVMKGYLRNQEATDAAFEGEWFHTGDLAVAHPDGYIELKDRSKDIIISGGENISSIEVENALYRHPGVAAAAVVARPDAKWGETPCAFVELRADAGPVSEAELIAFCREELAHFKAPKTVIFGALPKTSTGKIQKFALRERVREL